MAQPASRVKMTEINNHKQGRTGSGTMKKPGPARGRTSGNKTKGGGITKPTRGKLA